MSTVLILLAGLVLLALFIVWLRRHFGEGHVEDMPWWKRIWLNLRSAYLKYREYQERREMTTLVVPPPPAPEAAPAPAPMPPPPPPGPQDIPPPLNGSAADGQPPIAAIQGDLLHVINALVAQASSGDIQAVRQVGMTLSRAWEGAGNALGRLGRRLAEPDKHYGPEIWEPWVTAGAQTGAAGMLLSQADAMLASLMATSVGELAASSRQAPHHSQLNGGA